MHHQHALLRPIHPPIKARALDNSEVILPHPGGQQVLIFIVGFSRKSGEVCKVWSHKIAASYKADPRIAYYSLSVLQGAPSLFRPMIVSGIRKSVPQEERRRFVPIYSNESDWKELVTFSAPDDAYLIVATPDGHPAWQAHGAFSDAIYAELQSAIAALLKKFPAPSR